MRVRGLDAQMLCSRGVAPFTVVEDLAGCDGQPYVPGKSSVRLVAANAI